MKKKIPDNKRMSLAKTKRKSKLIEKLSKILREFLYLMAVNLKSDKILFKFIINESHS